MVLALVTFSLRTYINIGTGIFVAGIFILTTIFLALIFLPKVYRISTCMMYPILDQEFAHHDIYMIDVVV